MSPLTQNISQISKEEEMLQRTIEIVKDLIFVSQDLYAVEKMLQSLSFDELVIIAKIMYGGRDYLKDGNKRKLHNFMNYLYQRDAVALIDTISLKKNFGKFLQAGLECFDIDSEYDSMFKIIL